MSRFAHILVPVDFGDATQPAVDLALSLATSFDAKVTLLYAFDVTPFVAPSAFMLPLDVEPIVASYEKELNALRDKTQARWAKLDAVLRQGNVYETILDVAKVRGCDLIVMGTHGRRGLSHALLGSVAEKIVRLSSVPVLTVRPAAAQAAKATAA
jgi:nucleotide-binding universal stress UspA family protein